MSTKTDMTAATETTTERDRAFYVGKYRTFGHVIIGTNGRVLTSSVLDDDVRAVRAAGDRGLRVDPDFWLGCGTVLHADLPRIVIQDAERVLGYSCPSGVPGVITKEGGGEPQ